jgi:hypothetical protein
MFLGGLLLMFPAVNSGRQQHAEGTAPLHMG